MYKNSNANSEQMTVNSQQRQKIWSRDSFFFGVFMVFQIICTSSLRANDIRWAPQIPTTNETVVIELTETSEQSAWLHWGINADRSDWETPLSTYHPSNSFMDGVAIRSPFSNADTAGVRRVVLGPFRGTTQEVRTIDFAVTYADESWDSNEGDDYHIPVSRARISITPQHPGPNDLVTVSVHNSLPEGQLRWGVNADRGSWTPPVAVYHPAGTIPSEDGLAIDSPLSDPNAEGISTAIIGPFDGGQQVVTSIHMAVHWDKNWDTDYGRNYNLTIGSSAAEDGLVFMSPETEELLTRDFPTILMSDSPVELWLDGKQIATLLKEPYAFNVDTSTLAYGKHLLSARNGTKGKHQLATLPFWFAPETQHASRSLEESFGTTTNDDGSVTFALYAPRKHFVTLIGDFNQWQPDADVMHYSSNGIWWITKQLPPGSYEYQYLIDGTQRIADPYASDLTWQDDEGVEAWDPESAHAVVHVGQPAFQWEDQNFIRPPLNNVVIYEFFIQDLCPDEGFTGVTHRLDYIKDLGVTAIEPLPWQEFTGAKSWGYNPAYHFAPETTYGTPNELRTLINEAHKRDMAVIMDTVLNHMDGQGALFQLYGDDYDASPYFYLFKGENWGFPDLDQESEMFKRYVSDVTAYWINEYHIDGFRYDATRWVGWEGYNDWGAGWLAYAAKQADSNTYQIAEHIPSDPKLVNQTEMDSGWHPYFHWKFKDMLVNAQLSTNDFKQLMIPTLLGFKNASQRIPYIESHDEERIMHYLEERNLRPDESTRRAITAMVLTMTAPGAPMIYGGQEFGEYSPKTVGDNPLNWGLMEFPAHRAIYDATRILTTMRSTTPALADEQVEIITADEATDCVVYRRFDEQSEIITAINFGSTNQTVNLPLTAGNWRLMLEGRNLTLTRDVPLQYVLLPGQSLVLSK